MVLFLPVQKSYSVFSLSTVKNTSPLFIWSNTEPNRFSLQRTLFCLDVWTIFLLILLKTSRKKAIEPPAHESVASPWRDTIKTPDFLFAALNPPISINTSSIKEAVSFQPALSLSFKWPTLASLQGQREADCPLPCLIPIELWIHICKSIISLFWEEEEEEDGEEEGEEATKQ